MAGAVSRPAPPSDPNRVKSQKENMLRQRQLRQQHRTQR
jgi:hypothetical protein